jgi:GTP cyclohydrolase II
VLATDGNARAKFKAYWRKFGIGILMIRWLAVPAIKRDAERRYKAQGIQYSLTR